MDRKELLLDFMNWCGPKCTVYFVGEGDPYSDDCWGDLIFYVERQDGATFIYEGLASSNLDISEELYHSTLTADDNVMISIFDDELEFNWHMHIMYRAEDEDFVSIYKIFENGKICNEEADFK